MFACAIAGRVVGEDRKLETTFIYDEARPFEIRLQNVAGPEIVFARELLSHAFSMPSSGEGWIRFHIAADRFLMRLGYDIAAYYLSYPMVEVELFHTQMYDIMPLGMEKMDIDSLLDDFYNDRI
jgi:hypothetical protein